MVITPWPYVYPSFHRIADQSEKSGVGQCLYKLTTQKESLFLELPTSCIKEIAVPIFETNRSYVFLQNGAELFVVDLQNQKASNYFAGEYVKLKLHSDFVTLSFKYLIVVYGKSLGFKFISVGYGIEGETQIQDNKVLYRNELFQKNESVDLDKLDSTRFRGLVRKN